MANRRMWLVHRPSGRRVLIAKRMASGWYLNTSGDDLARALQSMFDDTQDSPSYEELDAFELELEW